jgi:hypothetical protein
MTYYFISLEPDNFSRFQRRIPLLSNGVWLDDRTRPEDIGPQESNGEVFFIHLTQKKEFANEVAIKLRSNRPRAKIVFVTQDQGAKELKEHQGSAAGGDAYVDISVDPDLLKEVLEGLDMEVLPPTPSETIASVEELSLGNEIFDLTSLKSMKDHQTSQLLDEVFRNNLNLNQTKPKLASANDLKQKNDTDEGVKVADNDELSLGELDIDLEDEFSEEAPVELPEEEGLDLQVDSDLELELGNGDSDMPSMDVPNELSLSSEDDSLSLSLDDGSNTSEQGLADASDFGELSLGESLAELPDMPSDDDLSGLKLNLGEEDSLELSDAELSLGDDDGLWSDKNDELDNLSLGENEESLDTSGEEEINLDFGSSDPLGESEAEDLSLDAMEKLKEIDAIMVEDASRASILMENFDVSKEEENEGFSLGEDLDQPLVSDDLDLDSLNFTAEDEKLVEAAALEVKEDKPKKKKKEKEVIEDESETHPNVGEELKAISGAYSGEMERTQATISNLRADREELLKKIAELEDEKVLQSRQTLSLRAELDEKKIELSIIRRKLNEEIGDLKDRLKIQEERKLILEEKNRVLLQEVERAGQKTKIDMKKVQMRERELEQKLELLKSDAETQIRNRDLKILELKRRIDAMEFDMESISQQEKRSVESRFELEDKLDKAIKTLRSAITVLEEESDRGNALDVLKKNIDM